MSRIHRCQIYSRTLAKVQHVLLCVRFAVLFATFTLAGLLQDTGLLHVGLTGLGSCTALRAALSLVRLHTRSQPENNHRVSRQILVR